jgi:hypothetical protein
MSASIPMSLPPFFYERISDIVKRNWLYKLLQRRQSSVKTSPIAVGVAVNHAVLECRHVLVFGIKELPAR